MSTETAQRTAIIAQHNDAMRAAMDNCDQYGRVVLTPGVQALPPSDRQWLVALVAQFKDFTPDNDPREEHDFAKVVFNGADYFWKIDYYDNDYAFGSDDPGDLSACRRVLTIMQASEY